MEIYVNELGFCVRVEANTFVFASATQALRFIKSELRNLALAAFDKEGKDGEAGDA